MLMAGTLAVPAVATCKAVARHRKHQRSGHVGAPLLVSLLSMLAASLLLLGLWSSVTITIRRDRVTIRRDRVTIRRDRVARGAGVEPRGTPPLSPGGEALLRRCVEGVRASKPLRARFSAWTRWNLPRLGGSSAPASSEFQGDLGWVETAGAGVERARAYAPTCVLVSVRDARGRPFDRGCFQRASFMAHMVSLPLPAHGSHGPKAPPDLRFAPDVSYLPSLSAHNVCYVAPHPGTYRLEISLMFTNTFQVQTEINASLAAGFAGYATAVSSRVEVTAPRKGWGLREHRQGLPVCSLDSLAEARTRGYWQGYTWFPYSCRLRRLTPFSMLRVLNRKNVLFLGDSETRYLYGVLQTFLSSRSRESFLRFLLKYPQHPGSALEALGVPRKSEGPEPPREPGSSRARRTHYKLSTGPVTFFGGRWCGFGQQRLQFRALPREKRPGQPGTPLSVDVNLTYVSHFYPQADVFSPWMLSGKLTDGERANSGGKFNLVIHSNQLHAVYMFPSPVEYGRALVSSFVPKVKRVCPSPGCTLVSLGPWVGHEPWKPKKSVHSSNNVRQLLWEDETYRILRAHGLPHVLHMRGLTAPMRGSELSIDPVHYRAPVTLAMLDLILGSLGSNISGPLL